MSKPKIRPPDGGATKRLRTQEELIELAQRLGSDWQTGDNVMTWIRRHEGRTGELSDLVHDGWSWDDVGRALALANIHYKTGIPMSGAVLRKKACEARQMERERLASENARRLALAAGISPGRIRSTAGNRLQMTIYPGPQENDRSSAPNTGAKLSPWQEPLEPEELAQMEPQFKPVSLRGGRKLPPPVPMPTAPRLPSNPMQGLSDDEIVARIFGKKR
ncbi:hypothetical protein HN018_28290 (plasmid) [Lichenicola cladoniae]|uniref:Uncharacterized protein n=1 Tax=Lichenicola cladoniae TaxID=1484109 RepID=A0A6M8I181_9PROT|nr:hypothetical protein [Lichenicola cladoniae]NPD69795.1 hypothetical protein [Acetobacteraceae bacterium]QKE94026.1 hypothetical protein HN018_28290 [Lichenicola cladoniae]